MSKTGRVGQETAEVGRRKRGRPKGSKSSNVAGEATRAKLIEISLDLFSRRGFSGVSIGALSEASGVAKGSITHHFPNKRKLYGAVLNVVGEGLSAACADAYDPSLTLTERLSSLVDGVLNWAREHQSQARMIAYELLELPERDELPKNWVLGQNLEQTLTVLQQGQEKGFLIKECSAVTLLEMILGFAVFNVMHKPFAGLMIENQELAKQPEFTSEARALLSRALYPMAA